MTISYSTLVGQLDLPLAKKVIPHQLEKFGASTFTQARIVVDDFSCALSEYENAFAELLEEHQHCRLVGLKAFGRDARADLAKHIEGNRIPERDYRGVPLYGWPAGIEPFETDYHFHSDCDIFYGGLEIADWLEKATRCLDANKSLFCVAPHPGPNGPLLGQSEPPAETDELYVFKTFSSRRFLVSKDIYKILPLPLKAVPSKKVVLRNMLSGKSFANNWEMMVSDEMQKNNLLRGHTKTLDAWAIHVLSDKKQVVEQFGQIVDKIERNDIPEQQKGHYDLLLDAWG